MVEGSAALAATANLAAAGGNLLGVFVVNTTTDVRGRRVPVAALDGRSWVGNLYQKQGNVFKYVLLCGLGIEGAAGVFGPVTPEQVQAAVDADGGTFRGWQATDLPSWVLEGATV